MILKFTRHAKERMVTRGLTTEQVKRAIRMGAKIKQTDGYESHYTYYSVCWEKIGPDIYKVKTIKIKD
jgi:hypothetical protein